MTYICPCGRPVTRKNECHTGKPVLCRRCQYKKKNGIRRTRRCYCGEACASRRSAYCVRHLTQYIEGGLEPLFFVEMFAEAI